MPEVYVIHVVKFLTNNNEPSTKIVGGNPLRFEDSSNWKLTVNLLISNKYKINKDL